MPGAFVIAKYVAQGAAGIGVGKIVNDIIKRNVVVPTSTASAVCVWLGSATLTGMVMDASTSYIGARVEEMATAYNAIKNRQQDDTETETVEQ